MKPIEDIFGGIFGGEKPEYMDPIAVAGRIDQARREGIERGVALMREAAAKLAEEAGTVGVAASIRALRLHKRAHQYDLSHQT